MARNNTMTQKEITKFIFENLEEVSSIDLFEICKLANEIHEKRTEQHEKDKLLYKFERFFDIW